MLLELPVMLLELPVMLLERVDADKGQARLVKNEDLSQLRVFRTKLHMRALVHEAREPLWHLLRQQARPKFAVGLGAAQPVVAKNLGREPRQLVAAEVESGDDVLDARVGDDRPHRRTAHLESFAVRGQLAYHVDVEQRRRLRQDR